MTELLLPIYRTASSAAEPGCSTYRINRTLDGSQVLVYEEYLNEEAYKVRICIIKAEYALLNISKVLIHLHLICYLRCQTHLATSEYQAFMKAKDAENLLTYLDLDVMEEVKA